MTIASISSFGSIKKKVPATPSQRYSPGGHDVFGGVDQFSMAS